MNNYDFYMAKPTLIDRTYGQSLPLNKFNLVPVIRVYGNLPTGHQVLCHIHGILPYIFINYDGKDSDSSSVMNQKCAQLHLTLEKKVSEYYSKYSKNNDIGNTMGNLDYIADVSVVKGVPFYGFHVGWTAFYKISLLNPAQVNKVSDLLRDGKILNKSVKTFESHIPFLLQFSADYNLFGCAWITLKKCYFRKPVLNNILDIDNLMMDEDLSNLLQHFCEDGQNTLEKKSFPRVGNGLLEIDILPQFIRNIESLEFRDTNKNFVQSAEGLLTSNIEHYVTSIKQMVNELTSQRSLFSLGEYKSPDGIEREGNLDDKWQSTDDYMQFFRKAQESMKLYSRTPRFDNFITNDDRFETIKNTYSSIRDLWPVVPKSLSSQKENSEDMIIDTLFHDYNTINDNNLESDHELGLNENDELLRENSMDADNGQTTIINDIDSSQVKSLSDYNRKTNLKLSLDFQFTQNMVKRRKVNMKDISKIQPRTKQHEKWKLGIRRGQNAFVYRQPPLDYFSIVDDLVEKGYPILNYQEVYFSNPRDLDNKPYIYAGKLFDINSDHLINRISLTFSEEPILLQNVFSRNLFESWKYNKLPPSFQQVKNNSDPYSSVRSQQSQIGKFSKISPFLYKFKSMSANLKTKKKKVIHDTLTHFSLEIHVNTRESLRPDPQKDEVSMIIWKLDDETYPFDLEIETEGVMAVNPNPKDKLFQRRLKDAVGSTSIMFYDSEFDMLDALTDLILLFDPDILSGFEVNLSSWGYLIERSRNIHKFNLAEEISRVSVKWKPSKFKRKSREYTHSAGFSVTGRYILNVWRLTRANLALSQYTLENIAYNVLHQRLPHYSYSDLTKMWFSEDSITCLKTLVQYWLTRVRVNIKLLHDFDFINQTMEQARLIGIDFHSVYYRGSQYKVESFLIRLCKSESFILISPTKTNVQNQKALECVPLVMEPEAAFYKSPMLILDFQSLYPSIMRAYNYCYSTMLGRVRELNEKKNTVGVSSFPLRKGILDLLENSVTIAPNGMVYVKPSIRESTLSRMLKEILDIRVMVKKTIAELGSGNERIKKSLNNKQLALKLLANVTYGYVSASFSGRMPCSDLADSIVQSGRETLEKAIRLIETNDKWGAKIVYGDTDSLFVYLPGKSKEDAFRIGNEMSLAVTKSNPDPIFLNFEKVYFPSILVSKKRYVGYSYEKPDQTEPIFDSKGIETVRRDGHPAQARIVEQSLRILFDTKDLSQVKSYIQRQFSKIYQGNVSIQDFCFAKEVKFGKYKSERTAPAGAVVAKRMMEKDRRAEPQYKERVPYLVVRKKTGEILRNMSMSPEEFMADEELELDSDYYINKTLIPPLSRLFNITGVNVADWAVNLTRVRKGLAKMKNSNVRSLGDSIRCCNCKKEQVKHVNDTDANLCESCLKNPQNTAINLLLQKRLREKKYSDIHQICRTCSYRYSKDAGPVGEYIASKCNSYDCPIYYAKIRNEKYLNSKDLEKKDKALMYLDKW